MREYLYIRPAVVQSEIKIKTIICVTIIHEFVTR
jgi:hypothetical protein